MIDPNIWQSEDFAGLSTLAKLVFIGLFSNADDEGEIRMYVTEIIADEVEFLSPKNEQSGNSVQFNGDLFADELAAFEPVDDANLPF